MDKKTISQKIKEFESLSDSEGYYSCYWGNKISPKKLSSAQNAHKLEDYVFFLWDETVFGSATNSLLFTDKGLSYRYDKEPIYIPWEYIDNLKFEKYGDSNCIDIDFYGKNLIICLSTIGKQLPSAFIDLLNTLVQENKSFISDCKNYFKNLPDTMLEHINNIKLSNNYLSEVIDRCDHFLDTLELTKIESEYDVDIDILLIHWFVMRRIIAFYLLKKFKLAKDNLIELIEKVKNIIDDDNYEHLRTDLEKRLAFDLECLAKIEYQCNNNYKDAIVYLSEANGLDVDRKHRRRIQKSIDDVLEKIGTDLINLNPNDRQLILCIRQIPPQKIKKFLFATVNTLKATNWKFPMGHPVENSLYVSHPLRPNSYFLMDNFHKKCFDDKFSELIYLLESLGASYICVDVILGESISSTVKNEKNIGVSLNLPIMDISVKKQTCNEDDNSHKVQSTGSWEMNLTPHGVPCVPEDLVWFHNEPIWQRCAQLCIKGNCNEFTINLDQKEEFYFNSKRYDQIEADINALIKMQKLGVKIFYRENIEATERQIKETVWKIIAKFSQPVYVSCTPYIANEELPS